MRPNLILIFEHSGIWKLQILEKAENVPENPGISLNFFFETDWPPWEPLMAEVLLRGFGRGVVVIDPR